MDNIEVHLSTKKMFEYQTPGNANLYYFAECILWIYTKLFRFVCWMNRHLCSNPILYKFDTTGLHAVLCTLPFFKKKFGFTYFIFLCAVRSESKKLHVKSMYSKGKGSNYLPRGIRIALKNSINLLDSLRTYGSACQDDGQPQGNTQKNLEISSNFWALGNNTISKPKTGAEFRNVQFRCGFWA